MTFRLLHCIGTLNRGGSQRQLALLLRELEKAEVRSAVLVERVDVFGQDTAAQLGFPSSLQIFTAPAASLPVRFKAIGRMLDEFEPHLVHLWTSPVLTLPAAFTARWKRIPVVSSQRGQIKTARQQLRWLCHLLGHRIVTNFPHDREPLALRLLYRLKKGRTIANAVDICSAQRLEGIDLPGSRLKLVTAGRLVPSKRIDMLIEAIDFLGASGCPAELYVFGSGTPQAKESLRRLARSLGVEDYIHLLGFREDWLRWAASADLFVLSSTSEGMPNVVLEASAAGLPLLASGLPGVLQVYTHLQDAYLFRPGDPQALRRGLLKLASDRELRLLLADKALDAIGGFSPQVMADHHLELYRELLQRSSLQPANPPG